MLLKNLDPSILLWSPRSLLPLLGRVQCEDSKGKGKVDLAEREGLEMYDARASG